VNDRFSALYGWRNVEPYYLERDICGTISSYRAGCRCDQCRTTSREHRAKSRNIRNGTTTTQPLIRGRANGWILDGPIPIVEYDPALWTEHAACKGQPIDHYFPARGSMPTTWTIARATCNTCPVVDDCLLYALRHGIDHGLWGGIPEKPRRRLAHLTPDDAVTEAQTIRDAWAQKHRNH
jgi:WhiB family redox-sensing transcriptional regulator